MNQPELHLLQVPLEIVQRRASAVPNLIQELKFGKSTVEARLYKTESRSNSTVVLLLRPAKFINYINARWCDRVSGGSYEEDFYLTSVNAEFGTTLARRVNESRFCHAAVKPYIAI